MEYVVDHVIEQPDVDAALTCHLCGHVFEVKPYPYVERAICREVRPDDDILDPQPGVRDPWICQDCAVNTGLLPSQIV